MASGVAVGERVTEGVWRALTEGLPVCVGDAVGAGEAVMAEPVGVGACVAVDVIVHVTEAVWEAVRASEALGAQVGVKDAVRAVAV